MAANATALTKITKGKELSFEMRVPNAATAATLTTSERGEAFVFSGHAHHSALGACAVTKHAATFRSMPRNGPR